MEVNDYLKLDRPAFVAHKLSDAVRNSETTICSGITYVDLTYGSGTIYEQAILH